MTNLYEKRSLYPCVDNIIGKQNQDEYRQIPLDLLAKTYFRDQQLNKYCRAWLKKLEIPEIDSECESYFNTFIHWASNNIEACVHSGIKLYDDVNRFMGCFDLIRLKHLSQIALIVIKTSSHVSRIWPIELSAYDHLCKINGLTFDVMMIIHLKLCDETNTDPQQFQIKTNIIEYENIKSYWRIFSHSLNCYNYFTEKLITI